MKNILRLFVFLLLLAGIAAAVTYREQFDAAALESWVNNAGAAGPLLFMLIYAIATVFFFPGSVLTLAGGALFGPVWGTFYNLTGATLGASISFVVARYLAHDWVEKKTAGRLRQLKQGVEGEGWKFVAFVRLVPLFPFNLLNYALGLTNIRLLHYTLASYLFMLPGAAAYTYLGYVGREALAGGDNLIQKVMIAIALLATAGFLPGLIGRLRRGASVDVVTLKQQLEQENDTVLLDVRNESEFYGKEGHIEQAILMPLQTLSSRIKEVESYRDKQVMLICHTDRRSAKAAQILAKHGFSNVHVVRHGMTAWLQAGYPVKH